MGIVIMKWDARLGTKIVAKYPEEINITDKTLMQIYSTHEYSGESGMVTLMAGILNVASYYTGPERGYYVILLLNLEDDPDEFEGGLADVSRLILQSEDEEDYKQNLPYIFQRLSVYPSYNEEQRLALTYYDYVKRQIIERLREDGIVSKSELNIWLKEQYRKGFLDIDVVLNDLIKREIIKKASVKGVPSELIFFTNDIMLSRVPPLNIILDSTAHGLPAHLLNEYKAECKKFFMSYVPTKEDNLEILDSLLNPQVYETLRLLRQTTVTRNMLEKLKKKGVDDIDKVLKSLWDNKMIMVFQAKKGTEYYALLSDFQINLVFPKYTLNQVISNYTNKVKAKKVLTEYLNILEDAYLEIKEAEKKAREAESKEAKSPKVKKKQKTKIA